MGDLIEREAAFNVLADLARETNSDAAQAELEQAMEIIDGISAYNPWRPPTELPDEERMCVIELTTDRWFVGKARTDNFGCCFVQEGVYCDHTICYVSKCKRWRYLDE
jgi:hypothetical protein